MHMATHNYTIPKKCKAVATHTHTHMHAPTHTHTHTHTYTYARTHTYTHTVSTVLKKFKVIYFSNVVKVGSGETQTTSSTNC